MEAGVEKGLPRPEDSGGLGAVSIVKTVEKFDGEYDFKNNHGMFIFRLVVNVLPDQDVSAMV